MEVENIDGVDPYPWYLQYKGTLVERPKFYKLD